MTSWADPQQLLLLFSLMLLAAWAIGGRFEFKGFAIPQVSPFSRVLCVVTGVSLLFVWLGLVFASIQPLDTALENESRAATNPSAQVLPEETSVSLEVIDNSSQDLVAIHRASLMSAIRNADEAQIAAAFSLDPYPLSMYHTGNALENGLAELQALAQDDTFVVATLHGQEFESFSVSENEISAEVRLSETWAAELYNISTQLCYAHVPAHNVPQTITLDFVNGTWMVSNIVYHSSSPGPVPGCG